MPHLVLNAARIFVTDCEVEVFTCEYPGDDILRDLRSKHRSAYCIRRTRDGLEAVAICEDCDPLPWKVESVRLRKKPQLISKLVLEALIEMTAHLGRPSYKHDPVTIPGGLSLLKGLPGSHLLPSWLEATSRFVATTRSLTSSDHKQEPFLVLDVQTTRSIRAPVSELVSIGFDPLGRYVGAMEPNEDPRLASKLRIYGGVKAIGDGCLLIDSATEDPDCILLGEAFVEPRHEVFRELVELVAGSYATELLAKLEERLSEAHQAEPKLEKLQRMLVRLNEKPLKLMPGIHAKFGPFVEQGSKFLSESSDAPPTTYIFDVGRSAASLSNRGGLEQNGPYNWATFTPTKPRFAIVCEEGFRGQVGTFLRKFKDGIKVNSGSASQGPYRLGFHRLFKIQEPSFDWYTTKDSSVAEYRRACGEIVDRSQASLPYDVVLLQNREATKHFKAQENPYLVSKASLLRAGIPSQSFLIEKTYLSDYDLAYVIADVALGTYAKLGGTPWLISADQSIDHEIVIGLGSAWIAETRIGPKNRLVGITSIFTGDGNYLLSNLSKVVPFESYFDQLLASLRISVDQAKRDMGWQVGDGVRIIIHAFKPMKSTEIEAVKNLVCELDGFDVHFAFVHVKEQHCFSLFDRTEPGLQGRQQRRRKGKFAPKRGTFVILSSTESLVSLWGAKQMRLPEHGHPKPLMLELHRDSTFKDIGYLSRQLVTFASHSWRTFSVSKSPVTILYSDLVADLLGRLSGVDGWSPEVLPTLLGKRRWFL